MSSGGAERFLGFVNASPSPYHAVATSVASLEAAGFVRLWEDEPWADKLSNGGKFYTTRFGTSIVAFRVGSKFSASPQGFHVIGAHTDSPCFKVKPVSTISKSGYMQLGVETYGGGLWYTWFDRDLTVAGRVVVEDGKRTTTKLVHVNRPILRIASLAIHLNREANKNFAPNMESQAAPILATEIKATINDSAAEDTQEDMANGKEAIPEADLKKRHHPALIQSLAEEIGCDATSIRDMDLYVADSQPSAVGGLKNEFMFSPRLDNQASCFTALEALISACTSSDEAALSSCVSMVCLFDHEEIGSMSAQGACSPFLQDVMARIATALTPTNCLASLMAKSFVISADMAHAVHPNYSSKHEENHRPALHKGVVIKTNQNQRYATNGYTGFVLREIAQKHAIPIQEFVVPNDVPCGSTIGPILSAKMGVRTVDVGMPQLAMHSCREMCGVDDFDHAIDLFKAFFLEFPTLDDVLRHSFQ